MNTAWIGVIGVISGVILGSGINFISTYWKLRQEDKREKRKVLIERLEETHACLGKIKKSADELTMGVLQLWAKMDFENLLAEEAPLERLSMLVHFYTPALSKDLKTLESTYAEFERAIGAMVKALEFIKKPPAERTKLFSRCRDLAKEVSEKAGVLQGKLAEHCRQIIN